MFKLCPFTSQGVFHPREVNLDEEPHEKLDKHLKAPQDEDSTRPC